VALEIKAFIEHSLIDWAGHIANVLFLPSCNYRCPFCHSSALVLSPETLPTVTLETVRAKSKAFDGWVDGIVVTGGEPTVHPDLPEFIDELKQWNLPLRLNTNGSSPEMLELLLERRLVDSVAMDVKAPLDERYQLAAGVPCDVAAVRASIELLARLAPEVVFRTTVCPGLHDEDVVADIARSLPTGADYVLQNFQALDCLDLSYVNRTPFLQDQFQAMVRAASRTVLLSPETARS